MPNFRANIPAAIRTVSIARSKNRFGRASFVGGPDGWADGVSARVVSCWLGVRNVRTRLVGASQRIAERGVLQRWRGAVIRKVD